MSNNKLKLNDLKTEFLLLLSPTQDHMQPGGMVLRMGNAVIEPSKKCQNLVVSVGYHHLRKIAAVKKYLPAELLITLTHAFISSRLDFCNSLYAGLPEYELSSTAGDQHKKEGSYYTCPP
jgi:hypothetical protein